MENLRFQIGDVRWQSGRVDAGIHCDRSDLVTRQRNRATGLDVAEPWAGLEHGTLATKLTDASAAECVTSSISVLLHHAVSVLDELLLRLQDVPEPLCFLYEQDAIDRPNDAALVHGKDTSIVGWKGPEAAQHVSLEAFDEQLKRVCSDLVFVGVHRATLPVDVRAHRDP